VNQRQTNQSTDFFNTISAICEFDPIQILRWQRTAGSTGRNAASVTYDGRQLWAAEAIKRVPQKLIGQSL
jgi:hypothetical protein